MAYMECFCVFVGAAFTRDKIHVAATFRSPEKPGGLKTSATQAIKSHQDGAPTVVVGAASSRDSHARML
jgi:hypothetical protein